MFNVLADSGATINILSEADYKSLRPTPLLRPTKTVISGFGVKEATPVRSQFSTLLKFRSISCQADIHVIKNPEKPIIGRETCKRLKLLSANTHSVNHISNSDAQTPLPTLKLLEDYADLFNGLGKLKEKKVHLHIDENIPPIVQRYRRVPFYVRKDIEELKAKDEKLGVIEKADGPTPWVSPIVVVPKRVKIKSGFASTWGWQTKLTKGNNTQPPHSMNWKLFYQELMFSANWISTKAITNWN